MTKQEALEEIQRGDYCNTIYFDRFLRKVDRTGQQQLIDELFGSEETYIDTQGGFDSEGYGKNDSIITFEEDNGYDVEAIFKWYCANFEKAWRWMFPKRTQKLRSSLSESKTPSDQK
jgi:hypothetical protein